MNSVENNDQWQPCPSGTLAEVAQQVSHRRRQVAKRRLGLVVLSICLLVIGFGFWQSNAQTISCSSAYAMLDDYIHERLDAEQVRAVQRHLASCEKCRRAYESMQQRAAFGGLSRIWQVLGILSSSATSDRLQS